MLLLPTGDFYSFNDALLNLLGYTKEEFSKLNLFNVATTMDEASCISQWDEIREKRNIVFECHFERKDGTLLDVEVSSNLINYNEYELNFSYINDITEKKKAEAEIYSINELLQRQTNRLLLATKSAELGIWDWDLENDSIIWDEGMCKLYGIAANEFKTINEEWIGRLHEEDRTEIENEIQLAIRNKKDYNTEFRIKWSDSSIHCIKATGIVERVNGKPKRMIGVNWDVTKEIEAVIEKERMIAELLENNLELKQFGFITTHNLRAPLTNLVMICNLINLEVIEDPSTLKLIEAFKTSTYQLNETLNDLINVLIIKENIDLKLDKLSFEEILDDVKVSIHETLSDSKVMIETDFSDVPTVHFTKIYLKSIFLNLITNSIRYQHPQRNPIIKIKTIKNWQNQTYFFR
jgi:PAS domain S-box-containing protein